MYWVKIIAKGSKIEEYKDGDLVIFSKWNGLELNIDSKKYFLIKEDEIKGKITLN